MVAQVAAVAVDRMMIDRATLTRARMRLLTSLRRLLQAMAKIHTRSVSPPLFNVESHGLTLIDQCRQMVVIKTTWLSGISP